MSRARKKMRRLAVQAEMRRLTVKAYFALWFFLGFLFANWVNSMLNSDLPYWLRIGCGVAFVAALLSHHEWTAKRLLRLGDRLVDGDEEER